MCLVGKVLDHKIRQSALEVSETGLLSSLASQHLADTVLEKPLQYCQQLHKDDINSDLHGPLLIFKIDRPASSQSLPVAGPIANSESLGALPSLM